MTVQRRQFLSLAVSAAALRTWSGATSFLSTGVFPVAERSPPACRCRQEAEIVNARFGYNAIAFQRSNPECVRRRTCLSTGEPIRLLRVVPLE